MSDHHSVTVPTQSLFQKASQLAVTVVHIPSYHCVSMMRMVIMVLITMIMIMVLITMIMIMMMMINDNHDILGLFLRQRIDTVPKRKQRSVDGGSFF